MLGQMVDNIMDNMLMIRSKELENIHGLMEDIMKENGKMVNNMERVNTVSYTHLTLPTKRIV